MGTSELKEILEKHKKWLNDEEGGERADLSYADLSGADLSDAGLSDADLSYAGLSGASLRHANLSGANLRHASLSYAGLRHANLRHANLSGADLSYADLSGADLSGADLSDAGLSGADLSGADLSYAGLSDANLRHANLRHANLRHANLSGADNLLSSIDYLKERFEFTKDGMIAYKCFDGSYKPPKKWVIQQGSVITENVNMCRTNVCGCGINVAPLEWVRNEYPDKEIWKILIRWEWLSGVCVPYNTDGKIRCERAELVEVAP